MKSGGPLPSPVSPAAPTRPGPPRAGAPPNHPYRGRPDSLLRLPAWIAALCLVWLTPQSPAAEKLLLAHYMPWYTAPPVSSRWGWHWTMNHFDPETRDEQGRRQIASHYHPLTEPYDSADPAILEYHVLLMKLAGLDGVIADWYGPDDYLDYARIHERTLRLFEWTRRAGLWFCLCYEDRTIGRMIEGGYVASTEAVHRARSALLEAERQFLSQTGYLRWQNRPVLLNFGPVFFTGDQWPAIFAALQPSNQPVFFTLDRRVTGATGGFNWPPMWASATNGGVLHPSALLHYLDGFEQKASAWNAFVSTAFPRFHDIYAQAGVGPSYGYLDDAEGNTFRLTLHRAMTNGSLLVQIATWNDFGEGTMIEPTVEFGYRDLQLIQEARRTFLDPAFPCRTADLALPLQLLQLRRRDADRPQTQTELDLVFSLIVQGDLPTARSLLEAISRRRPLLRSWTLDGDSLEIAVGGYLSDQGVEIQSTTNLWSGPWTTVTRKTNDPAAATFRLPVPREGPPLFLRARNL